MKAPYVEDVHQVGDFDATVIGVPFDGGCTYRAGTRFGPQGIRRISALYTPYNYEMGIDLREQMTLCDAGDVFTIPANLEKSFDQISNAVAHVASTGSLPIILGGDHSIGYPTVRGLASVTSKRIGIIHVDRHADIQEKGTFGLCFFFNICRRLFLCILGYMHTLHAYITYIHESEWNMLFAPVAFLRFGRANAHHALFPRHQPPQRPSRKLGPDWHRRMASPTTRRRSYGRPTNEHLHHGRH